MVVDDNHDSAEMMAMLLAFVVMKFDHDVLMALVASVPTHTSA
jgi:hypothetical protein